MLKITVNGIKSDSGKVRCFFTESDKGVWVYARDFGELPKELGKIQNDTEIVEDYFENDRCLVDPESSFYKDCLRAAKMQKINNLENLIKQDEKNLKNPAYSNNFEFYRKEIADSYKSIENLKKEINR